ncbi:MAG TPA: PAC2 family protein [Candidatus Bathyarchaeia archaeon]|nr:PAC2 family protein [Candidatus Bathyarchaeia archaeon]
MQKRNKSRSQRRNAIHTGLDNDTAEGKTRIKPLAKVVQVKKKLNSPILIAGFPGAGLVGSISTSYIINRLHMNQIACVESEFIVPGVIYAEGKLRHPFRLYSNERGDVCVLVCEAPVMIQGMHSVLNTVSKWILRNNVREVLVLDGIAVEGLPSSRTPIILSSDGREADAANLIHDYNGDATKKEEANVVDNADSIYPTTAFVGGVLSSCLSNSIPSKAILIYAARGIPDPEGAAILIESLGKITDNTSLNIDISELRKQGAALKTRMEKIIQSLVQQQQQGQQEQAQSPASVRDGVMYG